MNPCFSTCRTQASLAAPQSAASASPASCLHAVADVHSATKHFKLEAAAPQRAACATQRRACKEWLKRASPLAGGNRGWRQRGSSNDRLPCMVACPRGYDPPLCKQAVHRQASNPGLGECKRRRAPAAPQAEQLCLHALRALRAGRHDRGQQHERRAHQREHASDQPVRRARAPRAPAERAAHLGQMRPRAVDAQEASHPGRMQQRRNRKGDWQNIAGGRCAPATKQRVYIIKMLPCGRQGGCAWVRICAARTHRQTRCAYLPKKYIAPILHLASRLFPNT